MIATPSGDQLGREWEYWPRVRWSYDPSLRSVRKRFERLRPFSSCI